MNTRKVEITVGLFAAGAIAAFFMLAMSVSNMSSYTNDKGYVVSAHFDNIGGLKIRSRVSASGVVVGRVTDIEYNNDNYEAVVKMRINSKYNKFPTDTAASVLTSGLLGEQYVGLDPGADETYLKQGDRIELTQSAIVLEQIIGQFLYSKADGDKSQGSQAR